MEYIRMGRTNLMVSAVSFGALPIQRCSMDYSIKLLRKAFELGINYYDTANAYSDSEKKIGLALSDVRKDIIISTKSMATDYETVVKHINQSLESLKTDYIDLFQLHFPRVLPDTKDPNGAYQAAVWAKKQGYVRHIGITNHIYDIAVAAIESGDYDTLQYPFSYLSSEKELKLPQMCLEADMGYIAMKGMSGGLITCARAASAFARKYPNVVPIWGIQKMEEVEEWVKLYEEKVEIDDEIQKIIDEDRRNFAGDFCRCCGYCMPCSVGINIPDAARMKLNINRAPYKGSYSSTVYENMHLINKCVECGKCESRCPYGLKIPRLLREMLQYYDEFYEAHIDELRPIVEGK